MAIRYALARWSALTRYCDDGTIGTIDIDNTSAEGLQDLLWLAEGFENARVYVHHNENASQTFHPKVYVFRNESSATLLIGSNNITEAGLFANVEAALELEVPVSSPVLARVDAGLAAWTNAGTGLVRELDRSFWEELVQLRYVLTESSLRTRRSSSRSST